MGDLFDWLAYKAFGLDKSDDSAAQQAAYLQAQANAATATAACVDTPAVAQDAATDSAAVQDQENYRKRLRGIRSTYDNYKATSTVNGSTTTGSASTLG